MIGTPETAVLDAVGGVRAFLDLQSTEATGLWRCVCGGVTRTLFFDGGGLVGATSDNPRDYFGQALVRSGLLDERQLRDLLLAQQRARSALGALAVERGLAEMARVVRALEDHVLEAALDVLGWPRWQASLLGGSPFAERPHLPVEVDPAHVVEAARVRRERWQVLYGALGVRVSRPQLTPTGEAAVTGARGPDAQLLDLLLQRRSIAEIAFALRLGDYATYELLMSARERGWILLRSETGTLRLSPLDGRRMIQQARQLLRSGEREAALDMARRVLVDNPDSADARTLLQSVETALIEGLRESVGGPTQVPRLRVRPEELKSLELSAEEMFVLSRVNGEWDVGTLLQICPLREIDALRALNRFVREGLVDFDGTR